MDILQAKIEQLPLSQLVPNEGQMESIGVHANPRQINEVDYAKLVESMRADNLTGVMPLKVFAYDGKWIVLGGNMRLRALQELGAETAPCIIVPADTDAATLNKIIITDNSTFGDWDMDALANWDEPLADWGVDLPPAASEIDLDNFFEDGEKKDKGEHITIELPSDVEKQQIVDIVKAALIDYNVVVR